MAISNSKKIIDEILAIHLYKGVQPKDLIDTIFEDEYTFVNANKENDKFLLEVSYLVTDNTVHTMKYIYNEDKVLLRIEQKIGRGRYKLQWDRRDALDNLYQSLKQSLVAEAIPFNKIKEILSTLPEIQNIDDSYYQVVKCS